MAKVIKSCDTITEMAIVDVFTNLIFDADTVLGVSEQHILDSLLVVESSLRGASRRDISEFLRAMTIEEMIFAVNQLKVTIEQQSMATSSKTSPVSMLHH